jgi:hypothetical protein
VQSWFARESDGDCRSRLNHPATRVASRLGRPVTLASRFVDLPTDKRRFFGICFLHAILRTKSKEWQIPDLYLTGIVYAKNQSLNSRGLIFIVERDDTLDVCAEETPSRTVFPNCVPAKPCKGQETLQGQGKA